MNRLMKSRFASAGRISSSTFSKTRGKLSFVQFSEEKEFDHQNRVLRSIRDDSELILTDMTRQHVMSDKANHPESPEANNLVFRPVQG
jgi:hypothetical protein